MNKELIMLIVTNKYAHAIIVADNVEIELYGLSKYYNHLKKVKRNKISTIKNKLDSLYHFWLWSLCNEVAQDEDLQLYFARYLLALEDGFEIMHKVYLEEFDEDLEYIIYKSKPKQPSTIEKEKRAVESFFIYMNIFQEKDYGLEKNFLGYSRQSKHNKGSSYGLKMSKYMQNILLDDESILPSSSNVSKGDIRAFPFYLYDELLRLSEPQERLIFLLCGACSARIGQTLNLTLYDIDYSSKNVWLTDPFSNDQLGFHGMGRKQFLLEEYNIEIEENKEHRQFGFKYPIPTNYKSRTPLFWLNNNYKELFFNTLIEYTPLPEALRKPRHPFFFVRSTGRRLTKDEVHKKFNKHLDNLKNKYPEYKYKLEGLGLHSLRHMFGSVMATLEAKLIINGEADKTHWIRWFTSNAMGHRNQSSTDVYFNRPWDIEIELGTYFQAMIDQQMIENNNINRRYQNEKKY